MAKKSGKYSSQDWDNSHSRRTESYVQAIDALYNYAIADFSRLVSGIKIDPEKPFQFSDYPGIYSGVTGILSKLATRMRVVITDGSKEEWIYACRKNDAFLESILRTTDLAKEHLQTMQDQNLKALKTFQDRKVDGMKLSDRVWKYTNQFKSSIELGVDVAIGEGTSAQVLSRELQQYLKYPDKLFRKVKDKRGNLHLSKAAKAFHPGQGVYRSSSQNALRLARTEINMAYRTSEQTRWQKLPFVVGYEIRLSNNHTLNGKPFVDICDRLAGRYPKWFVFKGWHPNCRCHAIPILMDPDEFNTDELNELRAALRGDQYKKYVSRNQVNDVPDEFKSWVEENTDRSKGWKSQPYFIRDNFKGGKISGGLFQRIENIIRTEGNVLSNIIRQKEAEIRNRDTEKAFILSDDGSILLEKTTNSENSVSFTRRELQSFNDATLLHNHPYYPGSENSFIGRIGVSFSRADIKVAISNNLKEIRVVTPTYQFSMKRPPEGWPYITRASDLIYDFGNDVFDELESLITRGIMTERMANTLFPHLLWKRFAQEIGATYTKLEVISPRR